jgi:large subunit ribosomal protein L9
MDGEIPMEVILKEEVEHLGHRGDVVKVADGYARNYLLPRKLALQATGANKAVIEQMKSSAARRSATEKTQAEELVTKLEPLTLSFTRKSGENGHLFGSVTSSDIAAELAMQGFEVDRRKIQLNEPLKSIGSFKVAVKLHREVTAQLNVKVQGDGSEAPAGEAGDEAPAVEAAAQPVVEPAVGTAAAE